MRFFDKYKSKLNERQLNQMFKEEPKGFEGGMTAKKHMSITKASKATATRDLKTLEGGSIIVKGSDRNTRYYLNLE